MHFVQFENTEPQARINLYNIFSYYPTVTDRVYTKIKSIKEKSDPYKPTSDDLTLEIYTTYSTSYIPLQLVFKSREALIHAIHMLDTTTDLITVRYKEKPKPDESILKI